jgi:acid phosphatase family membrane protein YuiD
MNDNMDFTMKFEHKKDDPPIDAEKALKEFLGHTPLEVFGGAILGIIVAFLLPMSI